MFILLCFYLYILILKIINNNAATNNKCLIIIMVRQDKAGQDKHNKQKGEKDQERIVIITEALIYHNRYSNSYRERNNEGMEDRRNYTRKE